MAVARRPRHVRPGPATIDLPPDPPAIANLLCHDWTVTREAVPATFVDLAARGFIQIERAGDNTLCGLPAHEPRTAPTLTAYEERVLGVLKRRVRKGGVVPAGVLTTGNKHRA